MCETVVVVRGENVRRGPALTLSAPHNARPAACLTFLLSIKESLLASLTLWL